MEELLGWWPILWTGRFLVLILLAGACAGSILYFLRFFRWRSVAVMWNARLPRIKKLGGKVAGNEVGIELDEDQDEQFAAVWRKLAEIDATRKADRELLDMTMLAVLQLREVQRDFFNDYDGPPPGSIGGGEGALGDQ